MIADFITNIFGTAATFLGSLPNFLSDVFTLLYDGTDITDLGLLILVPIGIALGWFGLNFVIGLVQKGIGAATRRGRK